MRVLFDAQGSTEQGGGMRLHAIEIISTWAELFSRDRLIVIGAHHLDRELVGFRNVSLIHWPSDSVLFRAPGQLALTPLLGKLTSVDAVVSLSPVLSPLWRGPSVCFLHDWRHIRRPEQSGSAQRLYRHLWNLSAHHADLVACISPKTQRETLSAVPTANTICIPNGRDHARRWQVARRLSARDSTAIVTFGHHNNKRPELVIDAIANIADRFPDNWRLYVLGANGKYRETLLKRASTTGFTEHIRFPGFVNEKTYEKIMSSANCIVLVSSDEGFGLPLADAEYLQVPAVVASDSGITELFPDAIQADPTCQSVADALCVALAGHRSLGHGRQLWTWGDAVSKLRVCVAGLQKR